MAEPEQNPVNINVVIPVAGVEVDNDRTIYSQSEIEEGLASDTMILIKPKLRKNSSRGWQTFGRVHICRAACQEPTKLNYVYSPCCKSLLKTGNKINKYFFVKTKFNKPFFY
jgi:hypothetical protein